MLAAEKVIFFKGVAGVYEADPKKNSKVRKIENLSYLDYLERFQHDKDSVLHPRAVRLAQMNQLPLYITSFFAAAKGSWIKDVAHTKKKQQYIVNENLCRKGTRACLTTH